MANEAGDLGALAHVFLARTLDAPILPGTPTTPASTRPTYGLLWPRGDGTPANQ